MLSHFMRESQSAESSPQADSAMFSGTGGREIGEMTHMSRCLQEERCQANISRESEQSLRKYIALAENLLHHWCIR